MYTAVAYTVNSRYYCNACTLYCIVYSYSQRRASLLSIVAQLNIKLEKNCLKQKLKKNDKIVKMIKRANMRKTNLFMKLPVIKLLTPEPCRLFQNMIALLSD